MWHALPAEQAASKLDADPRLGLTPEEAANRLRRNGSNTVPTEPSEPWWKELLEALREPLQLLLIAVGATYFLLGEWADALTIVAVVLVVSGMEAGNELRARNAVAALSSLGAPMASVVRAGLPAEIPSAEVVAGDVVLLGPGHRVPADLRLVETTALRIDESSLTGESAPVAKDALTLLPADIDLAERRCMAYAGTLVTAGKGRGLVVATGSASEIGRIAELTRQAREPRTPLQQAMRDLSGWLLWVALGFSVLVPALGVFVAHLAPEAMLLTGLSLAFAVIPEELPILITGVLGLGAYRLARQHAIVRHLRAAETLGSVSVVATDKTGTLTQNHMRLVEVMADGHGQSVAQAIGTQLGRDVVEAGVVANDAQVAGGDGRAEPVGDPTEVALLVAAQEAGLDLQALRAGCNVVEEHPFDAQRKRMSVVCERGRDEARFVVVKGAVESVLAVCVARRQAGGADEPLDEPRRAAIQASVEAMAVRGLRVLALAERRLEATEAVDEATEQVERALVLLGVVGLEDPPRPEAASTVGTLRSAGVRVLMLTGDHPATARAIAERVGIPDGDVVRGRDLDLLTDEALAEVAQTRSVFARIAPEHKLRVVRALQARGEVVAVTGDGVNDAPALSEAAIGVAMGRSGTDVAREASDLVLTDDNLATVATAVGAGRTLYANLRKAVRYYLAAKVALVSASLIAVLLRLPVPFEPIQIIVMELFMDLGASVTFVAEPPEDDVMARPPRDPRRRFMDAAMQLGILAGGLSLGAAVLVAYLWTWGHGGERAQAQTAAFGAWMVGHLVLAAHMRAERQPLLRQSLLANRPFLVWIAAVAGVIALAMGVPPIQERLHVTALPGSDWAVAVASALVLPSWWEAWKWWAARARRARW